MIKSGKSDIVDVCTTGNSSPFSMLMGKTKTGNFFSIITMPCDMGGEEANLPPIDDTEGSNRKIYANREGL